MRRQTWPKLCELKICNWWVGFSKPNSSNSENLKNNVFQTPCPILSSAAPKNVCRVIPIRFKITLKLCPCRNKFTAWERIHRSEKGTQSQYQRSCPVDGKIPVDPSSPVDGNIPVDPGLADRRGTETKQHSQLQQQERTTSPVIVSNAKLMMGTFAPRQSKNCAQRTLQAHNWKLSTMSPFALSLKAGMGPIFNNIELIGLIDR